MTPAGPVLHKGTLEVRSPQGMIPVRATAKATLGPLKQKHNRLVLKAVCELGGQRYVDDDLELLSGEEHSNSTVEMDEKPFGGNRWKEVVPLGDCDVWLSVREKLGRGQFDETLLASRCRRDGAWVDSGCAELPKLGSPTPVGPGSVDVNVQTFAFEKTRDGRYLLDLTVDYGVKHAIHPDWDLEARVECSSKGVTATHIEDLNGVDLFELRPGEKARAFLPPPYKDEETLGSAPERCQVRVFASKTYGEDETHEMAVFCLERDEDPKTGACAVL